MAAAGREWQGLCRVRIARSGSKLQRAILQDCFHGLPVVMGRVSLRARVNASILPAAFSPRTGLLEDLAVFQADGGEAAAPDAAGVQGNEVGLQSQAQG